MFNLTPQKVKKLKGQIRHTVGTIATFVTALGIASQTNIDEVVASLFSVLDGAALIATGVMAIVPFVLSWNSEEKNK